jgi:hypothetical protein
VTDTPGVLVAGTGYWHQIQMDQIVEHGTHVLISPDAGNRTSPRPRLSRPTAVDVSRLLSSRAHPRRYANSAFRNRWSGVHASIRVR